MLNFHRRLDHDWQAKRREVNYSLFGNAQGNTAPCDTRGKGTNKISSAERWYMLYYQEELCRRAREPYNERLHAVSWLRSEEVGA